MVDYKDFYFGDIAILLGYCVLVGLNDTTPYKQDSMKLIVILLTVIGIFFQLVAVFGACSRTFNTLFVAQTCAFLYVWCFFFLTIFIGLLNVPNLCFFALAAGIHVHMFLMVN